MLKSFRCDLHIHTCLSPCADLDMYPRALIERCLSEKLDIIAICDHNSSENVPYVLKYATGKNLKVLPGMEVTSREEVHVLALFEDMKDLKSFQSVVYDHLPGKNNEEIFGCQAIVNELDEVEGLNDRLLIGATQLSISEVVREIHVRRGLAIAAHIDRESFSVLSQLGFVDPDTPFDALEMSKASGIAGGRRKYPELNDYPFISSSDAHFPKDIGSSVITIMMQAATLNELKMAFAKKEGRYIKE